jgi:hypothetical protein
VYKTPEATVDIILAHYGLPTQGTEPERIGRLLAHLGIFDDD